MPARGRIDGAVLCGTCVCIGVARPRHRRGGGRCFVGQM